MKFRLEIEADEKRLVLTPETKAEKQLLLTLVPEKGPNGEDRGATAHIDIICTGRVPYNEVDRMVITL